MDHGNVTVFALMTDGNHKKELQYVWSAPRFELGTHQTRIQCNEFRSALCSVHSQTLSQTALHCRRGLE